MEILTQLLIALVPAIITGLVAYYKATKNAEVELEKAKTEIEKAKTEIEKVRTENEGRIEEIKAKSKSDLEFLKGKLEVETEARKQMQSNDIASSFFKDINSLEDFGKMGKEMKDLEKTFKDLGFDFDVKNQ